MNEIEGITKTYNRIPFDQFEDSFVVDGNSTDGTREFIEAKGTRLITQKTKGLGSATIEAMKHLNTQAAVYFHPDGNMDPKDTLKFRPLLEQGHEFIIASRMLDGAYNEEDDQLLKLRKWANLIFARLASILWLKPGVNRGTDPVNGFRGITKEAFNKMEVDVEDCSIDYQMLIRAYRKNRKLIEFPTREHDRFGGETKFKAIPTGLTLLKMMIRELAK